MSIWILICVMGPFAFIGLISTVLFLIFYFQGDDHMEVLRRSMARDVEWHATREEMESEPLKRAS